VGVLEQGCASNGMHMVGSRKFPIRVEPLGLGDGIPHVESRGKAQLMSLGDFHKLQQNVKLLGRF